MEGCLGLYQRMWVSQDDKPGGGSKLRWVWPAQHRGITGTGGSRFLLQAAPLLGGHPTSVDQDASGFSRALEQLYPWIAAWALTNVR